MFNRFLWHGDSIEWFGLRKESHLLEGVKYLDIRPHEGTRALVMSSIRDATKLWKAGDVKNPHNLTMSKWISTTAIRHCLKHLERNPLPKIDFLFAEYMDNGMSQIVYFSVLLLYYAKRDIPLYVRDTEHKFRYISELDKLHDTPRDNMYSHRLGRYVAESDIQSLRGKIRMVYAWDNPLWDTGTDGFYKTPSVSLPVIYDPKRELPIQPVDVRKTPVVYIGNDNDRRPMFQTYYGGLKYRAEIYGNWNRRAADFVAQMADINPKVRFNDPIPQHLMLPRLAHSLSTVFVTKKIYKAVGQITDRACEVSLAGAVAVTPSEISNAGVWTLPEFIVGGVADMNRAIKSISRLSDKQYASVIKDQRKVISKHYDADFVMSDFIDVLISDGVRP